MTRNFCKMCGARLRPDAGFCHNCGCRLEPQAPSFGPNDTPSESAVPVVPTAQPEPNAAQGNAPALDTAAQNAQQSNLSFEVHKNENPFDLAQVDPAEIFHGFFGDSFPAPAPDVQTNAPAAAAAPVSDAQTHTPASTAAPEVLKTKPEDITALAPDLLALTVDVMADRPVIEPLSLDRVFEPQRTAEAGHGAARTQPSGPAAARAVPDGPETQSAAPHPAPAGAVPADVSDMSTPGAESAPVPGTHPAPGAENAPGMPPMPGMVNAPVPGAPPAPGMVNAAPVPPAPQYAPYMYGQPNAGPAPRYAGPAPHTPPPYPYVPGGWGYGAQEQPELISTGGYLGMLLTGMIPVAGFIYLIIQALGNQWRPNRRNFARGFLAAQAILIVGINLLAILAAFFMRFTGYYYY